jgi:hypothetical protein
LCSCTGSLQIENGDFCAMVYQRRSELAA